MLIGTVKISDSPPLKVRGFAAAQLVLDRTVEDPAVVWRENVLKLAQLGIRFGPVKTDNILKLNRILIFVQIAFIIDKTQ